MGAGREDIPLGLPGSDLVAEGIADLERGVESIASLLVCVGRPRLMRAGFTIPPCVEENPEHRLYGLLADEDSDSAHGRYNALIRRLVSFERAAECVI